MNDGQNDRENRIREIRETEERFARMAVGKGIHHAFVAFAADDAVLLRNGRLIVGKDAIDDFYKDQDSKGLTWAPELIDVSASGDLGYTYGFYTYTYEDSEGNPVTRTGIFHTVWKRQPDGSWKYVWD
ncbi:MAG: DUF4440 domain-containing protein [Candidatus Marinimicrobia bacterium]|nr:DUF4440 domain-containing protein [Candidatus Neomarinimicrobiota bacterium]